MKILFLALLFTSQAFGAIQVDNAKARATFAMAQTGAAYLTLHNTGDKSDRLTAVSVPASVAAMVELHTVEMQNDMMRMRQLENGIALAPNETVTLAPGGFHVMLMGLAGPLEVGTNISMTLHFEYADDQTITVPVVKM
jgi:copper(I)-binding protein